MKTIPEIKILSHPKNHVFEVFLMQESEIEPEKRIFHISPEDVNPGPFIGTQKLIVRSPEGYSLFDFEFPTTLQGARVNRFSEEMVRCLIRQVEKAYRVRFPEQETNAESIQFSFCWIASIWDYYMGRDYMGRSI